MESHSFSFMVLPAITEHGINKFHFFKKHFQTIAYSRRFHWPNKTIQEGEDYSMAQHIYDLNGLLNFLGNNPVHLVGHSYGALICLHLALTKPKCIRSLTLAEPPAVTLFVSNKPKPKEILKLLLTKPNLALQIISFGANGIAPATKAFHNNDFDEALNIFGKATLGKKSFFNLSEQRLEQARTNLIKAELLGSGFLPLKKIDIQKIKLPTLLISAQQSPKLWHNLLLELSKLIPHADVKTILNASHAMHEDNATGYNKILLSFLRKH